MPFLTVTDCDGYTVHAGGFVATSVHTVVPARSTLLATSVLKRDAGTMPRYVYWDMPAKDRAYVEEEEMSDLYRRVEEEEEMSDLYRRVLSDADPFAAECVYLTDAEISGALRWANWMSRKR